MKDPKNTESKLVGIGPEILLSYINEEWGAISQIPEYNYFQTLMAHG